MGSRTRRVLWLLAVAILLLSGFSEAFKIVTWNFINFPGSTRAVWKDNSNDSIKLGDSTTVYITKTGAKYHLSGCRYLRKSKIPISLREACATGYSPCSVCDPPPCPGASEEATIKGLSTEEDKQKGGVENEI